MNQSGDIPTTVNERRDVAAPSPGRYKRLWRSAIIRTSVVSIIPLLIMTVVSYHQDQLARRAESEHAVAQILSNTKRTLEFAIEERRSVLSLLINDKTFADFDDDQTMSAVLRNLKTSFGGFVDLGLVDSKGNQVRYTGPYDLRGRNYTDQPWFHEVSLRGVYVSDVFMGYRKFPHFVIAVKRERYDPPFNPPRKPGGSIIDGQDFYVLRATIDMEMLHRHIHSLDWGRSTDVFIVNREGVLQTDSRIYGKSLGQCALELPPYSGRLEEIDRRKINGQQGVVGYAFIDQSPFILLVISMESNPFLGWVSTRLGLVWFLVISIVVILIAIIYSVNYMVSRLREADQRRAKMFHNIEYTNKMATIGRMAAGVAHELNNPLAIINEKAGLLKDITAFTEDFPKRDKVLASIASILNSVDRCTAVTRRLLGFGRRMEARHEPIDLAAMMNEVVGFLGKEVEVRNLSIKTHVEAADATISSDRGQLQQVFLNLLNNAVAAVPDGGSIDISVDRADDNHLKVRITDNGVGIAAEDLQHIFEPFYSTKGEFGTGLGLSITYDIVTKLGGNIEVQSKPGEGASFTVTLPRRFA